jgi:polysaccharide biosynthesis protein PslH
VLFVGGAFYANVQAALWLAQEVAPHLPVPTVIAGSGLDRWAGQLQQTDGRTIVTGRVADLAPWYRQARLVLAPVFDGSGMKTKVAEAWMHGKFVVGTPEAFTGYDNRPPGAAAVCDTAPAFVAEVVQALGRPLPQTDPCWQALHDEHYSPRAMERQLRALFREMLD